MYGVMAAARIRSIGTAVPPTVIMQPEARDVFAAQPGLGRLGERLVRTSFDQSGIETRHTVLTELDASAEAEPSGPAVFYDRSSGLLLDPGTGLRNDLYAAVTSELVVEAARSALADVPDLSAADITHVVTVSCTGFFAPGPDFVLVKELGLRHDVARQHLGFMGCQGAFPALRLADAFCAADPDAVVLVVCVELCTLHVRSAATTDQIIANSVFADGAAAAVVTGRPGPSGSSALRIDRLRSRLLPEGEQAMAWTIGDHGFEMVLSTYVPKLIDGSIGELVGAFAEDVDLPSSRWAVHPGGRDILDRVQSRLGLDDAAMAPSRSVLRRFGNMSSATVLFILADLLHAGDEVDRPVIAMAFGPGLSVELGALTLEPAPTGAAVAGRVATA
ncbi:naringenin-chalcone synthase [Cnuibacter physcomitrellae]|nr:naringenin-chalcone synthase [Cnuibacter physcomitrellae]